MNVVGYSQITSAGGTAADTVLAGAAVRLYGFAVVSADANVDFYDGVAKQTEDTDPVVKHMSGDSSKVVFFSSGITFGDGVYLISAENTIVTLFIQEI